MILELLTLGLFLDGFEHKGGQCWNLEAGERLTFLFIDESSIEAPNIMVLSNHPDVYANLYQVDVEFFWHIPGELGAYEINGRIAFRNLGDTVAQFCPEVEVEL